MTFSIHGLPVARGIAIGRAVLVAPSRVEVTHYFIQPDEIKAEIERLRVARDAVVDELQRMQAEMPKDMPPELGAMLDVHLMLLQDETLAYEIRRWIKERLYNAEWALISQLEVVVRQFDEMDDPYLRERKADLEQVVDRVLRHLKGAATPIAAPPPRPPRQQDLGLDELAWASGVDRFRLSRAFKAAFGIAPHAYLVQLRLARARQLLARGQPPARVAMTLGFADQSHMGRWFRRAYGLTPAHYRRRCSNLPDR